MSLQAVTAVILGFSRNYISGRYIDAIEEREHLLRTWILLFITLELKFAFKLVYAMFSEF